MKTFFRNIVYKYRVFVAGLRFDHAVKLAEKAHASSNIRYYVMPNHRDELIIVSRSNIRKLRRVGIISPDVRMANVMKESFYVTPDAGGNKIPQAAYQAKRDMYFKYVFRSK